MNIQRDEFNLTTWFLSWKIACNGKIYTSYAGAAEMLLHMERTVCNKTAAIPLFCRKELFLPDDNFQFLDAS